MKYYRKGLKMAGKGIIASGVAAADIPARDKMITLSLLKIKEQRAMHIF